MSLQDDNAAFVSLTKEEVTNIKYFLENIAEDSMSFDPSELQDMRELVGDIGNACKNLATFLYEKSGKERDRKRDKSWASLKSEEDVGGERIEKPETLK